MKWLRKRGIPCLLLFSLIFSMLVVPVMSLAPTVFGFVNVGELFNDDTGEVGPLKISMLDPVARQFMDEYISNPDDWVFFIGPRDLAYCYTFVPASSFSNVRYSQTTDNNDYFSYFGSFRAVSFMGTGEPLSLDFLNSYLKRNYPGHTFGAKACVGDSPYLIDYSSVATGPISFFSYKGFSHLIPDGRSLGNSYIWKPVFLSPNHDNLTIYFDDVKPSHTLSIDYQYADGTEAASSYAALLEEGSAYDVLSPEIPGYTPDKASIAGEMGEEDAVFTVTYIKDPIPVDSRTLTIYYLLADGSQTAEPYSAEVAVGADYSVPSPVVSGYQTDRHTVSGTMGETDEVITVIYTPLAVIYKHTLTIRYQTADGRELAPVHSALLAEGEPYSVASPVVTGYQPDRDAVFGAMGTEDVLVTVIYTSSGTDPTMPGVDVSYQFEDGSAAAPACRKELSYGQFYWIASPSVPGYTPDRRILFGTVPRNGIDFIVTYRKGGGLGGGTGIPWLPSGGGGIQWEPPAVSGLPYQPSGAGGIPWKP